MQKARHKRYYFNIPIISSFLSLKGNAKACLAVEPLWAVPNTLYAPFFTLYVYGLGINDQGIGLISAVGFVMQMIMGLVGGILIDKLGRRRTLFVMDVTSWVIPFIIWATAKNIYFFLAAAVFNSCSQVTGIAWTCMVIEDTDKSELVDIFSINYIVGQLAVFVAPIAVILVSRFSVVPVVRGLYWFAFICMVFKATLLYIMGKETTIGKQRMQETKDVSFLRSLAEYKSVLGSMLKAPATRMILLFMIFTSLWQMGINNVFALYATQNLMISETMIPIFPMIKAGVMLLIISGLSKVLNRFPLRQMTVLGLGIFVLSHLFLLAAGTFRVSQVLRYILVICYVLCEAVAYAIVSPRRDTLMVWCVEPEQRSRINALINVIMVGMTAPCSYLVGKLSMVDRRLPFVMNILIFAASAVLLLCSDKIFRSFTDQMNETDELNPDAGGIEHE